MRSLKNKLLITLITFYTLSSFVPLLELDHWWIRIWDFPRLQLFIIGVAGLLLYLWSVRRSISKIHFLLAFTIGALVLDAYRIVPYTPVYPEESRLHPIAKDSDSFSVFTLNVFQDNPQREALLSLLKRTSPDIILLLEVDANWLRDVKALTADYPFQVLKPLDNTYGIALYSKLDILKSSINFLVEDDVPSIQATVETRAKGQIEIFCVHPRPPNPTTEETTQRDAELILIAKAVSKIKTPVLVMGDLNDVAWSHTSRLFRRISKLQDPRIGRGPYGTFPVYLPLWRFPLDYVFHSKSLNLLGIERLEDVGSDHFPLQATYSYEKERVKQAPNEVEEEDLEEADEIIQEVK
ncbi:MAG TPA: endonuclease/exonuclease/phosphatase family protein [Bacteriovoracaceae bacterium]|nr:endonuclease/exonuclease/phosphatase family protein [Bacteriovoracaceae bacterium]